MSATCGVPGCESRVYVRGFCNAHYKRWRRHGDPTVMKHGTPGAGTMNRGYHVQTKDGVRKFVHIAIVEEVLGKPLPRGAIVHHANGIKTDNRKENLVVCPDVAYHRLLHTRMNAMAACGNPNWQWCYVCQQYDDPKNLRPDRSHTHPDCWRAYRKAARTKARAV